MTLLGEFSKILAKSDFEKPNANASNITEPKKLTMIFSTRALS